MKKVFAVLLALCMMLSICACGNTAEEPPKTSDAEASTAAETPETSDAEEEAAEEPADSPSAAETESDSVYTAENPLVLKFTWAGTADDVRGQAFKRMADAVSERSGGAIQCEFYPGNELDGAADTVEMISTGANILQTVSADFTCDYGCPDMMLCNIFYTFDSVEKTLEFSNSDIFQNMCDQVADGGIKVLNLAWIEAPRQLMPCTLSSVFYFTIEYRTIGSYNADIQYFNHCKQNVLIVVKENSLWIEEAQSRKFWKHR